MANGYSSDSTQQELSNEYQHDRVKMIFIIFCFFVHWTKVALALEGLRRTYRTKGTDHYHSAALHMEHLVKASRCGLVWSNNSLR